MKHDCFRVVAGVIFIAITALHILRLGFNWTAVIGGWNVPIWISYIAVVVFSALSYAAFRGYKKCETKPNA